MLLHTIAATHEVPRHNRLHLRGSTRVPATSRRAPFPYHNSKGGILSLRGRERIPGVRRTSRGGALHRKAERKSWVVPPFPKSSRCLSLYRETCFPPHCLDFQAEDRLTPWWPVGQPCGKASWESLVGKPRGKATDPLIHAKGTVTLLLQLGRKAHVHALSRDND